MNSIFARDALFDNNFSSLPKCCSPSRFCFADLDMFCLFNTLLHKTGMVHLLMLTESLQMSPLRATGTVPSPSSKVPKATTRRLSMAPTETMEVKMIQFSRLAQPRIFTYASCHLVHPSCRASSLRTAMDFESYYVNSFAGKDGRFGNHPCHLKRANLRKVNMVGTKNDGDMADNVRRLVLISLVLY
jgi:hypothetical protein